MSGIPPRTCSVLWCLRPAFVGVVLLGAGAYIGAAKPDIWEHVPGVPAPSVPSPSGERAEPEESAR